VPFEVPETICIRGRAWAVRRESDLGDSRFDRAARRDLKTALGMTYYDPHEIHLRKHRNRRAEAQTFLHELLHACSRHKIPEKLEEKFIRNVEVALLQALEQMRWKAPIRKARRRRR
jgi:hypothetical protein